MSFDKYFTEVRAVLPADNTKKIHNYQMVDSRPIMKQVHELQVIRQEIATKVIKICETYAVNCFKEKLSLASWIDFKWYLDHK